MKTSLFDFTLPESLIASEPVSPRDSSRMLLVPPPVGGRSGGGLALESQSHSAPTPALPLMGREFVDEQIKNLPSFLKPGDVMVFNDTRVLPARLIGRRGEARVEILLHKQVYDGVWQCFAKPAKKLQTADKIVFADDFFAIVQKKNPDGQVVIAFESGGDFLREKLQQYGQMPLPPYIEKKRSADSSDAARYQTVYAQHEGSVAAPTAGLHFTPELLAAIDAAGVKRVHVTLHVGGGTFLPVKVDDTSEHVMHSEWASLPAAVADTINEARAKGGRIIAVGTTSLRTLESAADKNGVAPFEGETSIFITPGYKFKTADILLTNFHLPRSTLFMLVSAFSGLEAMQAAYAHAIEKNYRFYSYGDACLLYRSA
ncbi:MAG: tRNA preQ1(34) S-adenosylmethionine ribosyltransferase-isomerase QueA [Alphaproteobacteria bacterium]|nr:tRNA preQ1(34) S-adenosylmethionine ribosyltransferase-isomerase QueA [Alphaproteobacteria bacterium]